MFTEDRRQWLNNGRYWQLPVVVDRQRSAHHGRLDLNHARRLKPSGELESVNVHRKRIVTFPDVRVMIRNNNQRNHLQWHRIPYNSECAHAQKLTGRQLCTQQLQLLHPLNDHFFQVSMGQPPLGPPPPSFPEENLCGLMQQGSLWDGCPSCHPTTSVKDLLHYWREHKALTLTSSLTISLSSSTTGLLMEGVLLFLHKLASTNQLWT